MVILFEQCGGKAKASFTNCSDFIDYLLECTSVLPASAASADCKNIAPAKIFAAVLRRFLCDGKSNTEINLARRRLFKYVAPAIESV